MFLIARAVHELASWDGADGETKAGEANKNGYFERNLFAEGRAMSTIQGRKMASSIFIGRWTPKILFSLRERPHRHGQLRRRLGCVSQRMLTRTLRNLESAGLITRRMTQSKAITVECSLTKRGRTIIALLRGMCLAKAIPPGREC